MSQRYLGTDFVAGALAEAGIDAVKASPSAVASHVLAKLRKGFLPTATECERLNGPPLIEELRHGVTSDDLGWIWDNITPTGDQRTAFCISLLRAHSDKDDVQERLKQTWIKAKPHVRTYLLWRILDDTALGHEWHARLFEFVLEEWDTFQSAAKAFTGSTDEEILVRVFERFGDRTFPETKKWAYLCTAAAAAERRANSVRAVLDLGSHSRDGFTRQVASTLRKRLFKE